MRIPILAFILSLVVYSMVAVAYVHGNFIGRDYMELVIKSLDRIELKLDKHIAESN